MMEPMIVVACALSENSVWMRGGQITPKAVRSDYWSLYLST